MNQYLKIGNVYYNMKYILKIVRETRLSIYDVYYVITFKNGNVETVDKDCITIMNEDKLFTTEY